MLSPDFVAQLRSLLPVERVLTDTVDCFAYAYDNSRRFCPPDVVVFPVTGLEVQEVLALCNRYKTPATPRGRGTGTAGGSLPEQGGVACRLSACSVFFPLTRPIV